VSSLVLVRVVCNLYDDRLQIAFLPGSYCRFLSLRIPAEHKPSMLPSILAAKIKGQTSPRFTRFYMFTITHIGLFLPTCVTFSSVVFKKLLCADRHTHGRTEPKTILCLCRIHRPMMCWLIACMRHIHGAMVTFMPLIAITVAIYLSFHRSDHFADYGLCLRRKCCY